MRTEKLNYDLPTELIAQSPSTMRSQSRLLIMNRKTAALTDGIFNNVIDYLRPCDCLVLNDTKVLPARFFGHRVTGAKLEFLYLNQNNEGFWEVVIKNARKVKPGETIILCDKSQKQWCRAKLIKHKDQGRWQLEVAAQPDPQKTLSEIGFAPLPPYIKRDSVDNDLAGVDIDRYQTVYAQKPGAVAAPTAGLHFSKELLAQIGNKGVTPVYVTLHVGLGTFKPVTTQTLDEHNIHSEWYNLSKNAADTINDCKNKGGRIIAVGTTSVRTLETIGADGEITAGSGKTKLFIRPGYEFEIVDAMVTNFHLPKSTLLALVGAFAGLENVLGVYKHAIEQKYRFYSYGDAMLII